jgi:hypothetical protein
MPIGVVITRPPEIFSILNLPTPGQRLDDVFVVFDSHSRPSKHPNGSAFLFFPTLDHTAAYLGELLHVDSSLLDGGMSWQMQLFSHYSGHFFVIRKHLFDTDSALALYDANMCILELKLSQAEIKTSTAEYQARIQALESENASLHAQIRRIEKGKAVDLSPPHPRSASSSPHSMERPFQHSEIALDYSSNMPSSIHATSSLGGVRSDTRPKGTPEMPMDESEQASLLEAYRLQANMNTSHALDTVSVSHAESSSNSNSRLLSVSSMPHDNSNYQNTLDSEASSSAQQASMLLAYQVQADFSSEDSALRTQLQDLRTSQSVTFQCGICMETYPIDNVCTIDERHNFCRGCLKENINIHLQEHRFPIFCPLCVADKAVEPRCMHNFPFIAAYFDPFTSIAITRIQAEQLGLSQAQAELWIELELAKFSLMLPCRK